MHAAEATVTPIATSAKLEEYSQLEADSHGSTATSTTSVKRRNRCITVIIRSCPTKPAIIGSHG